MIKHKVSESEITDSEITDTDPRLQYVGFWLRFGASVIDSIILIMFTYPFLFLIYGGQYFDSAKSVQGFSDVMITYAFPIIATILFWIYKSATPGKILLQAKIVDEKTGDKPTVKQSVIRYFAYYVSLIPLGLGFFWIAWDDKKQGWHDKIAGTIVIRCHQ
ncbi:RDD family protein [Colwellia sp. MB02u-18]|uniref:RDD family protein n=1 Tax=unclassified Colwellia TaxID=196834 RepID=UPI0015F45702|nr:MULTISPECIES: RDD family protein [unclassified Colwellia]MBA6224070.1 RDD family protein [Colwellia sp. MB3u-45]MBA6269038.1 RDD family protein [Colwellia sp. MB3u-43]MBA6320876.1 RDD family protein [Colwellia sp. MB02u-19]MBA6324156.1 RDD family protein [Colwellia sp. MB02u-18]MBA6332705.1 RDD family protein [Colwellia sp. MB02u-12]